MKDKNALFSVERKGYNRFEVEQRLKQFESEKAMLFLEIDELKKQLSVVVEENIELKKRQMLVEETLINAHLAAQDIIKRAEIRAAEIEADKLKQDAKLVVELADKKKDLENMLNRVEYILKSQLALLNENISAENEQ